MKIPVFDKSFELKLDSRLIESKNKLKEIKESNNKTKNSKTNSISIDVIAEE